MPAKTPKQKSVVPTERLVDGSSMAISSARVSPTNCTFRTPHLIAAVMMEWLKQHKAAEVKKIHQRVVEGELEEEEVDEVKDEVWDESAIKTVAAEGLSILQGVLLLADGHHVIRQNELSLECFKSAKRASRIVKCVPIPTNTPYIASREPPTTTPRSVGCCFSGRTRYLQRIQFEYRDPCRRTISPLFTVHTVWHDFLLGIAWIAAFPLFVKQHVESMRASGTWARRSDIHRDLSNNKVMSQTPALLQLQNALALVEENLAKHRQPLGGRNNTEKVEESNSPQPQTRVARKRKLTPP